MNIIWFGVLKPLYALGLPVAVVLAGLTLPGITKEPSVTLPVLTGCALYFALGYVLFVMVPDRLRSRLMRHFAMCRPPGFAPRVEATSVLLNRYLGIDLEHRQAYFVDVSDGTKKVIELDAVSSWEVVAERNKPPLLTLVTEVPGFSMIRIPIERSDFTRVTAQLQLLSR